MGSIEHCNPLCAVGEDGREEWRGSAVGLTPLFPPSQSLSNNKECMTRHLGFPLLSASRERRERVSSAITSQDPSPTLSPYPPAGMLSPTASPTDVAAYPDTRD